MSSFVKVGILANQTLSSRASSRIRFQLDWMKSLALFAAVTGLSSSVFCAHRLMTEKNNRGCFRASFFFSLPPHLSSGNGLKSKDNQAVIVSDGSEGFASVEK